MFRASHAADSALRRPPSSRPEHDNRTVLDPLHSDSLPIIDTCRRVSNIMAFP